jgi:hypothetical protein
VCDGIYFAVGEKGKAREYFRKGVEALAGESDSFRRQDVERRARALDDEMKADKK